MPPAARTSAPGSAPRPSRAIIVGPAGPIELLPLARRGGGLALADLVRDHLAPRVGPADRADAMGHPRAVAARAFVQPRRARLVGGAALVAPAARGPLLRNGHGERAMVPGYSSSSPSFAQRGSVPPPWSCSPGSASFNDAPQTAHNPAQSGRQRIRAGSARTSASCAQASTSMISPST